jgi:phosphate ABC transporter phosphate-binding protein
MSTVRPSAPRPVRLRPKSAAFAAAILAPLFAVSARTVVAQPDVHKIFVETTDNSGSSREVEKRLVSLIERGRKLQLATSATAADATLTLKAVIWPQGTYVPNPHSGAISAAGYQGYASVELTASSGPLWSYLATPGRLHLSGITGDLASQIYDGLNLAIGKGLTAAPSANASSPGSDTRLRAAGATFPAPLYRRWFEFYAEYAARPVIAYEATGSVEGLQLLASHKIDLAASDIPNVDGTSLDESSLLRLPTVIGGVVPIFNLPGIGGSGLKFTPELLAAIYSGSIHRWSDPAIRRINPGVRLPEAEIAVVHRSDGSGTTFVWTSFLASASPQWKSLAGATVAWPIGVGATGNEGVAAKVVATPNAIGYVELTFAIQHQLSYGSVRNPAGHFIHADLPSLIDAAQSASRRRLAAQRPRPQYLPHRYLHLFPRPESGRQETHPGHRRLPPLDAHLRPEAVQLPRLRSATPRPRRPRTRPAQLPTLIRKANLTSPQATQKKVGVPASPNSFLLKSLAKMDNLSLLVSSLCDC